MIQIMTWVFQWNFYHHETVANILVTSCARSDTICLRPLQVDNIFTFIRQVAPVPACINISNKLTFGL